MKRILGHGRALPHGTDLESIVVTTCSAAQLQDAMKRGKRQGPDHEEFLDHSKQWVFLFGFFLAFFF